VQQTIIDPEGDFVALAERFGHLLIDAEDHTERGLQVAGERARIHRVSTVLNLEGLDAENQMRRAAAFLGGLFDVARDHWYPMLVVVDEAQLFAPAVAGEVTDEGAQTLARRHDEPDVPRPQTRACGDHRHPATGESSPRTSRPRRPISSWAEPFWISTWRAPPTFWAWSGDRQRRSGIWSAGNSWRWDRRSPAVRSGCALVPTETTPRNATPRLMPLPEATAGRTRHHPGSAAARD
jgi:hypothetical protein